MLERTARGELPRKHHTALRGEHGELRYEQCLTRNGFDGAYSIVYHQHRPHALEAIELPYPALRARAGLAGAGPADLRRRHFRTTALPAHAAPITARLPLLENRDVRISALHATTSDPLYFANADADELFFLRKGRGVLRSIYGDLPFAENDYVGIPKGTPYRMLLQEPCEGLLIECRGGLSIPQAFRNETGQLRMDAPYCHRDFRKPDFTGPNDEGIRELVVLRHDAHHAFATPTPLLDVVGWDGSVYPFAFPILAFQPRVSSVHLPPTWHGTFAARGALICSFVPRPLDFDPQAIACPYPHASVDVDEVLYYVAGEFTSRTGVADGSLTLHPAGIAHGPQPGRYEASLGQTHTDELAVMLDCYAPLSITAHAQAIEDSDYEHGFRAPG